MERIQGKTKFYLKKIRMAKDKFLADCINANRNNPIMKKLEDFPAW